MARVCLLCKGTVSEGKPHCCDTYLKGLRVRNLVPETKPCRTCKKPFTTKNCRRVTCCSACSIAYEKKHYERNREKYAAKKAIRKSSLEILRGDGEVEVGADKKKD